MPGGTFRLCRAILVQFMVLSPSVAGIMGWGVAQTDPGTMRSKQPVSRSHFPGTTEDFHEQINCVVLRHRDLGIIGYCLTHHPD